MTSVLLGLRSLSISRSSSVVAFVVFLRLITEMAEVFFGLSCSIGWRTSVFFPVREIT